MGTHCSISNVWGAPYLRSRSVKPPTPMLQVTTRPLSDAERRLLRRRSSVPKLGSVYWMRDERRAALVTVSICAAIVLIAVLVRFSIVGAVVAGAFALMRFNGYRQRNRLRRHMLAYRQRLAEELESGQAHTITCRPSRIIEREEFEDEGALWIFDGGEGRYLVICGQEYYETPRFPSSHFELVMGARHRLVIGIRSHGLRVPSTIVVKGDDIAWDSFPDSAISFFTAPRNAELSVILRGLGKATAA